MLTLKRTLGMTSWFGLQNGFQRVGLDTKLGHRRLPTRVSLAGKPGLPHSVQGHDQVAVSIVVETIGLDQPPGEFDRTAVIITVTGRGQ